MGVVLNIESVSVHICIAELLRECNAGTMAGRHFHWAASAKEVADESLCVLKLDV